MGTDASVTGMGFEARTLTVGKSHVTENPDGTYQVEFAFAFNPALVHLRALLGMGCISVAGNGLCFFCGEPDDPDRPDRDYTVCHAEDCPYIAAMKYLESPKTSN